MATRKAGFQDFDQAVVSYYTAQFKNNSLAAISQRASRSRRLRTVLQELQECSSQWPRRESRGLYEGLVEMTSEFPLPIKSPFLENVFFSKVFTETKLT